VKAKSFRDIFEEYDKAHPTKATTCAVCNLKAPLRKEVDELLKEGKQRSQIARALKVAGHPVTDHTVRHHAKNHIAA
jgi:hypothetical protein